MVYKNFFFLALFIFYSWGANSAADPLSRDDFIQIAKTIWQDPGLKEEGLDLIITKHCDKTGTKSFFHCGDNKVEVGTIIDQALGNISYISFRCEPWKNEYKLVLTSDLPPTGIYVGCHIPPGDSTRTIDSDRVMLFFSIERIVNRGKPWVAEGGFLVSAYPGNPTSIFFDCSQKDMDTAVEHMRKKLFK